MLTTIHITELFGMAFTLVLSCLLAEFFGYWLHRLLHSDKIRFLSHGHLIHHLLIYGPGQPMRHDHYHDATDNRFSVGNIGLEWLIPSAVLLGAVWLLLLALHLPAPYQLVVLATLIAWPIFTFSYLHDRMHLCDFWMAHHPVFRRWFLNARRLHDIHHHALNTCGRMDTNFGIGFFLFDRLFRTLAVRHRPFNRPGFEAARDRYGLVEHDGRLVPSTDLAIYSGLSGGVK
jgi:sterol desaturase/sphingolipid hydroxylase (fatty acid hydroxylase superfamily)